MIDQDDFYIGYATGLPASLRRPVTLLVSLTFVIAAIAAALFVSQQRGLADARFDYTTQQSFDGYLSLTPTPALIVAETGGTTVYWLVAPGKYGAHEVLGDARSGWVTLRGKRIARESWRMIEVAPDSLRRHALQPSPPDADAIESIPTVLRGEIVDGKCYMGVMNPGERTVHRDCAVRCISGGVPPMFAYHDADGAHLAMLFGGDPETVRSQIGRPVVLSGALSGPEQARVFDISSAR